MALQSYIEYTALADNFKHELTTLVFAGIVSLSLPNLITDTPRSSVEYSHTNRLIENYQRWNRVPVTRRLLRSESPAVLPAGGDTVAYVH